MNGKIMLYIKLIQTTYNILTIALYLQLHYSCIAKNYNWLL